MGKRQSTSRKKIIKMVYEATTGSHPRVSIDVEDLKVYSTPVQAPFPWVQVVGCVAFIAALMYVNVILTAGMVFRELELRGHTQQPIADKPADLDGSGKLDE